MKAALLLSSCWHGLPNYRDVPCVTSEAKHLMEKGGRSTGRCMGVGEATAVHRCSCVLSRCSASPLSNWQMASDARWFNGLRVCFFLPQSAISRDICNELAGRTAESGSWDQHFLMGVVRSWQTWAVIKVFSLGYDNRDITFQIVQSRTKTYNKLSDVVYSKKHSITRYHLCDSPLWTFTTPEKD